MTNAQLRRYADGACRDAVQQRCPKRSGSTTRASSTTRAGSRSSATSRASGQPVDRHRRPRRAVQPRPPRRVGRRGQHRRRRRHPAPGPRPLPRGPSSTSPCRRPGAYGVGLAFLPARRRGRRARPWPASTPSSRTRASGCVGWREVPVDTSMIGPTALSVMPELPAAVRRRPRRRHRPRRSTASCSSCASAASTSSRARRPAPATSGLLPVAVEPHPRLQGHAHHAPARPSSSPTSPTSGSSRRWRWCTAASPPTRSRRGRSRTRTATSPTTARSTPCRATATGCAPARR